jgi:hypothetical protein
VRPHRSLDGHLAAHYLPHEVPCFGACAATLSIAVSAEGWSVQHGANPEHRSPVYQGDNLIAVCDWIDAVHERSGVMHAG